MRFRPREHDLGVSLLAGSLWEWSLVSARGLLRRVLGALGTTKAPHWFRTPARINRPGARSGLRRRRRARGTDSAVREQSPLWPTPRWCPPSHAVARSAHGPQSVFCPPSLQGERRHLFIPGGGILCGADRHRAVPIVVPSSEGREQCWPSVSPGVHRDREPPWGVMRDPVLLDRCI
jgi:hypothetical protein